MKPRSFFLRAMALLALIALLIASGCRSRHEPGQGKEPDYKSRDLGGGADGEKLPPVKTPSR